MGDSLTSPLGYAIAGCGYIADQYAQDLAMRPELALIGATDVDAKRAQALTKRYGGAAYPALAALLADPCVDIVVNLTAHHAHFPVTAECLSAGKHVFSEKPLATSFEEARSLLELARRHGVRLSCAPFTFMGEAQQTAGRILRSGALGTLRLIYADVNAGRIETWHPAPQSFYAVGPLFDVGGYALAMILSFLGPARRVSAWGAIVAPERKTAAGDAFTVTAPDTVISMIELRAGPMVRLTTTFYPNPLGKHAGIEFHGDSASLFLGSSLNFDAAVEVAEYGQPYATVPCVRPPQHKVSWGAGVCDLADAIKAGRPHRASGEMAAHIVEILCGAEETMRTHQPIAITSNFDSPAPMDWAA
jgi:predicted dehydrogenase